MTDREILNRGYKEAEPSDLDSESVDKIFQKRIMDDNGTKYFIDVKKWNFSRFNQVPAPIQYEYHVQLQRPGDKYLSLCFHPSWTIEEVETYMEKLFNTGDFEYYEK